jgi:hypothetical protein
MGGLDGPMRNMIEFYYIIKKTIKNIPFFFTA